MLLDKEKVEVGVIKVQKNLILLSFCSTTDHNTQYCYF